MSDSSIPVHETPKPAAIPAPAPPDGGLLIPPPPTAVEPPEVGPRYIWFQVLGQFGVFMAFITPLAISLTIRVDALAPGHPEVLGYVTGAGALWVMLTSPFMGIWSDRTRTRLGRRRPFMIGGMLLGVVSLFVMALAPNVLVLGLGWILAQWGWGTTLSNLQISTADRLPASQRGKVAGFASFATQIAPVIGVMMAQFLTGDPLLLFLLPGAFGVLFVTLFVTLVHEDDARDLPRDPMTVGQLLKKYLFNPLRYPDFSLNWLARFLFYFGLTLSTTYTAFFFANRLSVTVEEVAGIVGILSLGGVFTLTLGAVGGGFLSDRLRRRRLFILIGGAIMAAGMLTQALGGSNVVLLFIGSLVASVGLGLFASVDQALLLDVLPNRDVEAGRFMGITGFATSIPQSIAPLAASGILLIGVNGEERNYTLLFIVAATLVLLAGIVIMRIRQVR